MPYATASDGTRLWFTITGDRGDPLVLVAGTALDHHAWDPVIEEFSTVHRVLTFDHRGVGGSDDVFPTAWTTRDFAADVLAILDAAGLGRAHVYGHSMGGRVSQWLAADAPDRVGALVLGGSSVGEKHGVPRSEDATRVLTSGDLAALTEMFYTPEWAMRHAHAAGAVVPRARSAEAMQHHLDAAMGHDGWDALPRIAAPTLVVHGSEDPLSPAANAAVLADRIPRATALLVEGARHAYWAGFPTVHRAVLDFLAAHPLPPSPMTQPDDGTPDPPSPLGGGGTTRA